MKVRSDVWGEAESVTPLSREESSSSAIVRILALALLYLLA